MNDQNAKSSSYNFFLKYQFFEYNHFNKFSFIVLIRCLILKIKNILSGSSQKWTVLDQSDRSTGVRIKTTESGRSFYMTHKWNWPFTYLVLDVHFHSWIFSYRPLSRCYITGILLWPKRPPSLAQDRPLLGDHPPSLLWTVHFRPDSKTLKSIHAITRMCRDRMDKQRTFDFHLMSRMNRFVDRVTHLHDNQITMKKVSQTSMRHLVTLHQSYPI